MTEREVMLTGIGGQGIQLAARVLAEAALHDGREVQLFASYGGMMRGGRTDATVVIADGPIDAPPVVSQAWAVLGVHPDHLADPLGRLRPEGIAVLNAALVPSGAAPTPPGATRIELPVTTIAQEAGNPMAGALVAVAVLAAATGVVGTDGLRRGVDVALPPYRRQHVESCLAALDAGIASAPVVLGAWPVEANP